MYHSQPAEEMPQAFYYANHVLNIHGRDKDLYSKIRCIVDVLAQDYSVPVFTASRVGSGRFNALGGRPEEERLSCRQSRGNSSKRSR